MFQRSLLSLVLSLGLVGFASPAWAIEGHCVAYCDTPSYSSSSSSYSYGSYDYSGYSAAGEALGQGIRNMFEGFGQALDNMIQAEIRRQEAWKAARQALLQQRARENQAREDARSQRESRHYAELTDAANRINEMLGVLQTELTRPAAVAEDFQFMGGPAEEEYVPIEERYDSLQTESVPSPQIQPKKEPFQFKKIKDLPQLDRAVELVNKGIKKWEEFKEWGNEKIIGTLKEKAAGALEAKSGAFKYAKGIKDRVEDLYKKIGGAHERTASGLLEGIEQGVHEAGSPDITGDADVKMEQFWKGRGEAYDKMAKTEIKSIVKGKVKELQTKPHDPNAWTQEKSRSRPILGLKSYDRQRQEALNLSMKQWQASQR